MRVERFQVVSKERQTDKGGVFSLHSSHKTLAAAEKSLRRVQRYEPAARIRDRLVESGQATV